MSTPNRIVARINIRNPEAVPAKYVRRFNALAAERQEAVHGGDGVLLRSLARKLSFVHCVGGNVVTYGPKATRRVVAILTGMGLTAGVEFGRLSPTEDGHRVVTETVNQKRFAAMVAGA